MAEEKKFVGENALTYLKTLLKNKFAKKVDKEFKTGSQSDYKVLSDNNLTDELKQKILDAGDSSFSGQFSDLSGKPTTIAGYGITDAKIEGKTVTLGSESVTVPTNNNQLENGAGYQTSSEVQSAINTATNDMATKTYVTQQLANINKKQIVTSIEEMTDANIIYLMSSSEEEKNNIYDEYLVINGKPEKVGTTAVDLTNYLQTDDLVEIQNQKIDEIFADL